MDTIFAIIKRKAIRNKIAETEMELGRKLTKEEKEEITKQIAGTSKRRFYAAFGALLGALGIATVGKLITDGNKNQETQEIPTEEVGSTLEDDQKESKEKDTKEKDFKDSLKVTLEELNISNLDSVEDIQRYLKDIYIEQYEKMTGDESLTIDNIEIKPSNQSYVYLLDDGRIVSHGDQDISKFEGQMEKDGLGYQKVFDPTTQNIKTCNVVDNKGNVIDSIIYGTQQVKTPEGTMVMLQGRNTSNSRRAIWKK